VTHRTKTIWTGLIAVSLLYQVSIALLIAGHDATEYGTLDTQGRRFGFNDPITWGHFHIMLANVTIKRLFDTIGWYSLCGLIAHPIGIALVWVPKISHGARQLFFALQTILFPLGWLPVSWMLFASQFVGQLDGESIQDGPISVGLSQVSWWLAAIVIFIWDLLKEEIANNGLVLQRKAL